jgi:hypothetical protein
LTAAPAYKPLAEAARRFDSQRFNEGFVEAIVRRGEAAIERRLVVQAIP